MNNAVLRPLLAALISFLCYFAGITEIKSQESQNRFFDGFSINASTGANLFYGDIEVYSFVPVTTNNNEWRAGYSLMAAKRLNDLFGIRGQILHGQLSGTKRTINRYFESDIIELNLNLTLNLNELLFSRYAGRSYIYLMGGVGISQWETELKNLTTDEVVEVNGGENGSGIGGRTLEGVLPFGAGINFMLNDRWHLTLEGSLRPVNSDLLDATEGDFAYDFYSYNSIGISYNFNIGKQKPPIEYPVEEELITETEEPQEEIVEEPEPVEIPEIVTEEPEIVEVDEDETIQDESEVDEQREIEKEIIEKEARTDVFEETFPGVEFRVQVMASNEEQDASVVRKKYNLDRNVKVNYGDGWYRYSIGSFGKYWKAKEYRNRLVADNYIYDAFVVAYKGNNRLSLAQLMNGQIPEDETEPKVDDMLEKVTFRVQIMASRTKTLNPAGLQNKYGLDRSVKEERVDEWYQYTSGQFDSYRQAEQYRDQVREKGIGDAFVVAYKNGKRIPISSVLRNLE